MGDLALTFDRMTQAANQLETGQLDIDDILTRLLGCIDELISEGFVTTHASTAFNDSYTAFTTSARDLAQSLVGLGGFLRGAASTFDEADRSIAAKLKM